MAVEIQHGAETASALSPLIRDLDFGIAGFLRPRGGLLVAEALTAGTWHLDIDVAGMASIVEPVEIRANEETHVFLKLEPGTDRTISFRVPAGAAWDELRATVSDSSGRLYLARSISAYDDAPTSILATLPIGCFTIQATTDTGLAARGTLCVPDLEPQSAPVTFALH